MADMLLATPAAKRANRRNRRCAADHHPGLLVREGFLLRATSSKSCTVK